MLRVYEDIVFRLTNGEKTLFVQRSGYKGDEIQPSYVGIV